MADAKNKPIIVQSMCASCFHESPALRCGACHQAHYCNRECQRAHYTVHRPTCLLLTKQIDKSASLDMQCKTMGTRFAAFSKAAPIIAMLLDAVCKLCLAHDIAKLMLPVVGLSANDDKIYVRMSPRILLAPDMVERFVKCIQVGKAFACMVEPFPWTATIACCLPQISFEVDIPPDQRDTPAGKYTLEAMDMASRMADMLLLNANVRAEALLFHRELREDKMIQLNPPVLLLRPQVEQLFTTPLMKRTHAAYAAAGKAELQPAVLSQLERGGN